MQQQISIHTKGKGLHSITHKVQQVLNNLPQSGILNLFIHHTSASLLIQENADPTAKKDIETFLDIIAPEHQPWHTHTLEGPDDTTSHLKSTFTHTSLNIPIINGSLGLGTWQGIYLCEHRTAPHIRNITLTTIPCH